MERKILLNNDTMNHYVSIKSLISNNPNLLLKYYNNSYDFVQEFIVDNENEVRYYYAVYKLSFSTKMKPYLRRFNSRSFSYNKKTKKLKEFNTNFNTISSECIDTISKILGKEWFTNFTKDYKNYIGIPMSLMYRKSILKNVWCGKITNPEDLIKFYAKNILRVRNVNWKIIREYLKLNNWYVFSEPLTVLRLIDEWVINPNMLLSKIIELFNNKDRIKISDYSDYIRQIAAIGIKSNVAKWSDKRFKEEHNKLSLKLMEIDLENKDSSLLFDDSYNDKLPKNIRCCFINSEKKCFREGMTMHNCIYTNYWSKMEALKYFAISIDDSVYGRATLGITFHKQINSDKPFVFIIEQIRGIRNTECNKELSEIMHKWVDNNQELFNEILEKNKPNYFEVREKVSIFA